MDDLSSPDPHQRSVEGSERPYQGQERSFYYVSLFRTSLILLAGLLLAVARSSESGLNLERALPFLDSTLALWCVLQLSVLCSLPLLRRVPRSLKLHVTADLIFSLALVWWTGGVESFFLPILYANVLSTSAFYGLKRALAFASAATLTLVVMTVCMVKGWSPAQLTGIAPIGIQGRVLFVFMCLTGEGIAFHLIAFLGARLMAGWRQAERFNHLIIDNIGEGIIALDERGRMVLMNEEAQRILGYLERLDWKGRPPSFVFRRADDAPLRDLLENPVPGEVNIQWKPSRRESIPLAVRLTRIEGESPGSTLSLAVFRDRTLELRASDAQDRIRRLKEMEDTALGIVHEIRNPLASLRGCVQEIASGKLDTQQTERFSSIVLRESDRLDRIVNEFLELSRTGPTREERVDLARCLAEVAETLGSREDTLGISISVDGMSSPEVFIKGQRELIYRLFLNLGINALEACQEGDQVRLSTHAGRPDGCEARVEDTGSGMGEATRERVFHPFFTTKPREGGLGLALVQRIVHTHGGTIDVESEPGRGTTFRVWFPAMDNGVSAPEAEPQGSQRQAVPSEPATLGVCR